MKRRRHHFPYPRQERSKWDSLLNQVTRYDGPVLRVDRSVVPLPFFREQVLPKKRAVVDVIVEDVIGQRQPLVVQRDVEDIEEVLEEYQEETPNPVEEEPQESVQSVVQVFLDTKVSDQPLEERVSVIIAYRGRDRLAALKKSIDTIRNQSVACHIVLVEQDHISLCQKEIEPLVDSYLFAHSRTMFNKSWAFNCGVIIAPDELVMLHDGDLLLPENYIKGSIEFLASNDLVLPWAKILYLSEESSKRYPNGPIKALYIWENHNVVGGSLLTRKSFYLNIGGMDERFEGWGGEDNAFFAKACKLGRVKKANLASGTRLFHHFHKQAPRSHGHYSVNTKVMLEYYNKSEKEVRAIVRGLGTIGDPLKYTQMENIKLNQGPIMNLIRG
jgi:hypothetical protein